MQYMLIYAETAAENAKRSDPSASEAYWGAWSAYMAAMNEAGVVLKGDALLPPHTASTVRVKNGLREVEDGPYADVQEQLGGFVVIEAADLDAALAWAAKAPCAADGAGCVEVRPVLSRAADTGA